MASSHSAKALLLAALLAAPLLAGCLGGSDTSDGEELRKQRADVSASLGGVQGVVTDSAVQPIEGANVTLVELDQTTRTASDGSYAFSLVQPGTYTLTVNGPDVVSAQESVTVRADQVAVIDFILARLVSEQPFVQAIEFAAFFECGVGARHPVENPGSPLWFTAITWATCATVNSVIPGGNATNDRFAQDIRLEPPIETLVWEAAWDTGSNTLAENLWLTADIAGQAGLTAGNQTVFQDISVSSPFWTAVHRPHFENISAHFKQQCEGGEDTFCGYNFDDLGWPITVRTFTATDCLDAPVSACAPLQLKVDHVFTGFYHAPAPEGFTALGGGV